MFADVLVAKAELMIPGILLDAIFLAKAVALSAVCIFGSTPTPLLLAKFKTELAKPNGFLLVTAFTTPNPLLTLFNNFGSTPPVGPPNPV